MDVIIGRLQRQRGDHGGVRRGGHQGRAREGAAIERRFPARLEIGAGGFVAQRVGCKFLN
jgi:hypothetical protein